MSNYREMAADLTKIIDQLSSRCGELLPPADLLLSMHVQVAKSNLLSALTEIRRLGDVLPKVAYVAPTGRPTHFPIGPR
jgi:hypothetical protein